MAGNIIQPSGNTIDTGVRPEPVQGVPVSSYSTSSSDYSLRTLEDSAGSSKSSSNKINLPKISVSHRKAVFASLGITAVVVLLTAAVLTQVIRRGVDVESRIDRNIPTQGIELGKNAASQGSFTSGQGLSVLVGADIIAKGDIRVSSGQYLVTLSTQEDLQEDVSVVLPGASGTICLDSNNCDFANQTQMQQMQGQIGNIIQGLGGVRSVNGIADAVNITGTQNRVNVSTVGGLVSISAPQDLHSTANVQFGNLSLSPTGQISVNTIRNTSSGRDILINASNDELSVISSGITFRLPTAGPALQTICTTVNNCTAGMGLGDIINGGQIGPVVIGTMDATDLTFNTTNTPRLVIQANGNVSVDSGTLFVDSVSDMVGVGTSSPAAKLHVNNGSFLVQGINGGPDTVSVAGSTTRMYFDVSRSAFRAGRNASFGDGVIGNYSAAFGNQVVAPGFASLAAGQSTNAAGTYSVSLGFDTVAVGAASTALGFGVNANSYASVAIGKCNVSSGQTAGSWVATDQLFVVGNSDNYDIGISDCATRSNAFEVLKNGNTMVAGSLTVDTNTLFVDSVNNNVGIGTSSADPNVKLQVAGSALITDTLSLGNQATYAASNHALYVYHKFNPGYDCFGICTGNGVRIEVEDTINTERVALYGGILTVSGSTVIDEAYGFVHVNPQLNDSASITDNYGIYLENQTAGTNNYGIYIQGASTYALWVDSGTTRLDGNLVVDTDTLFVDSSTNRVGIGTATPTEALQVTGNILLSNGSDRTIKLQNATAAATPGNNLNITGSNGNGASGGGINIQAGAAFSGLFNGGNVNISAGNSTLSGGHVNISGGTGNFANGNVVLQSTFSVRHDGSVEASSSSSGAAYHFTNTNPSGNGLVINTASTSASNTALAIYANAGLNPLLFIFANGDTGFSGNVGINALSGASRLNINTIVTADPDAQLAVATNGILNKGVIVQGANGQLQDLLQAQDYTGAILASISATGHLTVSGATINGTLTVNGNTTINGHVISGNTSGSTTVASGVASDCADTASVLISGNDVSGRVTIDTGSGACSQGVMATITFAQAYDSAPNVVLTPANSDSASLGYYAGSANTTDFTIDTSSVPVPSTQYVYTYHVIQ